MKLLINYLKCNIYIFVLEIINLFIFSIVLFLYDKSIEPILYALFISLLIQVIYFIYDFNKYINKCRFINNLSVLDDFNLPKANKLYEKEYQEVINKLVTCNKDLVFNHDLKYTNMIDYYTMWAHQIKTPIQALRLLTDDGDILDQVFKIEEYVDMVLQFLRLDNMNHDLLISNVNIDDVIKKSVKKYAKLFIKKKISLIYKPVNYIAISDEKWLSFVLDQILSNALKYTKQGSIKIYMEMDNLIIEDTGIGIQKEDLERVFENSFTGLNGRKDTKATGIGLYLCRNILNKLSHQIHIESKVNVGSKVIINLSKKIISE